MVSAFRRTLSRRSTLERDQTAAYRTADGIKVAFQTVNSTPVQIIKVKIAKVEHNVTIDDAMFTKK